MSVALEEPSGQLAESVEEHRDALESWAESDLPLSDDMQAILDAVDGED